MSRRSKSPASPGNSRPTTSKQSGSSDAPSPVARGNSENSLSRFTTLPPISPVDLDAKVKDVKDQISPVETFALADEFQQTVDRPKSSGSSKGRSTQSARSGKGQTGVVHSFRRGSDDTLGSASDGNESNTDLTFSMSSEKLPGAASAPADAVPSPVREEDASNAAGTETSERPLSAERTVPFKMITECTQTEWSWMEDMQMIEKMRTRRQSRMSAHSDVSQKIVEDSLSGISNDEDETETSENKPQIAEGIATVPEIIPPSEVRFSSPTDDDEAETGSVIGAELKGFKPKTPAHRGGLESEMTFASESSIPYPSRADEYGVPLLDISSESDDDDEIDYDQTESDEKVAATLPSIGPPEIIKYQKESDKPEVELKEPSSLTDVEIERMRKLAGGTEGGMFEGTCEFCGNTIKPFPSRDEQKLRPPEDLYCCNDYQEFVMFMINHPLENLQKTDKKIDIKPHAPYGSKQARNAAKEKALARMRERELARQQQAMQATTGGGGGGGGGQTYYQFARQMKTINYMLSSQKCLDEGWTLRPPTPVDDNDVEPELFEPEPVLPGWAETQDGEARDVGVIIKYYPDGSLFVIMFSDGTGTVYYPSGRIAITISAVELGRFTYIVHEDSDRDFICGVFDPHGVASTNYSNGALRLCMDPFGGVELDAHGRRKRRWTWKDWRQHHVHAPPLQPITFSLTPRIGVRIMSQEQQTLTFTCRNRSVRFQVGAKLKLLVKELPPMDTNDEDELFRADVGVRIQALFGKLSNLLRFPNSSKVIKRKSRTRHSLNSSSQKMENIREDRSVEKYKTIVTVN